MTSWDILYIYMYSHLSRYTNSDGSFPAPVPRASRAPQLLMIKSGFLLLLFLMLLPIDRLLIFFAFRPFTPHSTEVQRGLKMAEHRGRKKNTAFNLSKRRRLIWRWTAMTSIFWKTNFFSTPNFEYNTARLIILNYIIFFSVFLGVFFLP